MSGFTVKPEPTNVRPPPPTHQPPFSPIDCDKSGTTHNLHGDCKLPTAGERPPVPGPTKCPPSGIRPTGGKPETFRFNALHISRLDVKVDGHTEHVFIAILNGSAIGQVIAVLKDWNVVTMDVQLSGTETATSTVRACQLRMLYVMPVHRHKGVATRLFQAVEEYARREKATQLELCVLKGNTPGRQFWIRRGKFIDDTEREAGGDRSAEYACMVKTL